jgi:short-subunit dehydrogenase
MERETLKSDFPSRYGPWALIAGGSDGIGAAYAQLIAGQGINVVLLARRAEALEAAANDIRAAHPVEVRTVALDLTDPDVLAKLTPVVEGLDVGLLVFNAGATHGAELFVRRPVEHALHLVDMNCRAVALFAHHFGSAMASRGRGGIVLMTSLSAVAGAPYTAMYSATKAFDLVLAEGLWMELGQVGVDVVAVPAGLTDTPSMQQSGIIGRPGMESMDSWSVAAEVLEALGSTGPLIVPGEANRAVAAHMWPMDRGQVVESMGASVSALYELPLLAAPRYA